MESERERGSERVRERERERERERDLAEVKQHAEEARVLHQLHGLWPGGSGTRPLWVSLHSVHLVNTHTNTHIQ